MLDNIMNLSGQLERVILKGICGWVTEERNLKDPFVPALSSAWGKHTKQKEKPSKHER